LSRKVSDGVDTALGNLYLEKALLLRFPGRLLYRYDHCGKANDPPNKNYTCTPKHTCRKLQFLLFILRRFA
jgi:hypothetical protein